MKLDTDLKLVQHLLGQSGISLNQDELEYRALQWATPYKTCSGCTAQQFVD